MNRDGLTWKPRRNLTRWQLDDRFYALTHRKIVSWLGIPLSPSNSHLAFCPHAGVVRANRPNLHTCTDTRDSTLPHRCQPARQLHCDALANLEKRTLVFFSLEPNLLPSHVSDFESRWGIDPS